MHHDESMMTFRPRYLRATLITGMAAAVVPVLFGALGVISVIEGPSVSGGEAQGAAILFVHAVVALLFVVTAYPCVAWFLYRQQALIKQRFYRWLFIVLIGFSLMPAAILAAMGFGTDTFILAPASFALIGLLALPFRPLWFRLAQ